MQWDLKQVSQRLNMDIYVLFIYDGAASQRSPTTQWKNTELKILSPYRPLKTE